MRILFFGTYEAERHERVKVLIEGLTSRGHYVRQCNVPLRMGNEMRVRILRRPVLVPLLVVRVVHCWVRLTPRAIRIRDVDVVVVGHLGQFDVLLARLLWPRAILVLDYLVPAAEVAWDHGMTDAGRQAVLSAIDRAALSVADVLLVDTEEHRVLMPAKARDVALIVPTGAPNLYHDVSPSGDDGPLRVIFVGTFSPFHGTTCIAEAIALLGDEVDVLITMIGRGRERDRTRQIIGDDRRVTWVDWLEPGALALELARHQVCLGVFGTTGKTARVMPGKVFQGAAAGCAIVTGRTAPQECTLGSVAFMVPCGEPQALADILTRLSHRPDLVAAARRETRRLAEQFRPLAVVEPVHRRVQDLSGHDGRRRGLWL